MPAGGIRTHSLGRRAAADLRLRPRGHWNRQTTATHTINLFHPVTTLRISGAILLLPLPVPLAVQSKAQVCGRSPAETVGSNPTGGMDVCLL